MRMLESCRVNLLPLRRKDAIEIAKKPSGYRGCVKLDINRLHLQVEDLVICQEHSGL